MSTVAGLLQSGGAPPFSLMKMAYMQCMLLWEAFRNMEGHSTRILKNGEFSLDAQFHFKKSGYSLTRVENSDEMS